MAKKKIHKLSVNLHSDFHIIGISSHENDYRLSWAINSQLNFSLSKSLNLEIFNDKKSEMQEFSVFTYNDENDLFRYDLISNRCHDGFLLPEYKNIDFFMLIHGELEDYEFNLLLGKLKHVEIVTLAFPLQDLPAKSKEKLLF